MAEQLEAEYFFLDEVFSFRERGEIGLSLLENYGVRGVLKLMTPEMLNKLEGERALDWLFGGGFLSKILCSKFKTKDLDVDLNQDGLQPEFIIRVIFASGKLDAVEHLLSKHYPEFIQTVKTTAITEINPLYIIGHRGYLNIIDVLLNDTKYKYNEANLNSVIIQGATDGNQTHVLEFLANRDTTE